MKKEAEKWFKNGEENLRDAKILLEQGGSTGDICFLSHQGVEKFLKGFLVLNKKKYRLIHDLVELLKDCGEINEKLSKFIGECEKLTGYYISSRYPLPYPIEHSREEAEDAVRMARNVIGFIRKIK